MPQSLSKIYLHLIFSTKNRMPMLIGSVREPLHRYTATVLESLGCHAILINSVEDHVHILFELARTVAVSAVVEEVKTATSKWLKTQPSIRPEFSWQSGYGVFSVGGSNLAAVRKYIANQEEHHRRHSFQDEMRALLDKFGISYDERYLWD